MHSSARLVVSSNYNTVQVVNTDFERAFAWALTPPDW